MHRMVTCCRYLYSRVSKTVLGIRVQLNTKKRGVAAFVPEWNPETCIQCNKCAYVCPHASIRPFVLDANEQAGANFATLKAVGKQFDGMTFRVQVDVMDCLGCGNCADVCPGNPKKGGKALTMKPLETQLGEVRQLDLLR